MPYCRKCGTELSDTAVYCSNCGTRVETAVSRRRIDYANWGERFISHIIDVVVLSIIIFPIKLLITWPSLTPPFLRWIPFFDIGMDQIIHFLYWTFLEGSGGQSVGKMIMKLKVTKKNGEPIDMIAAAIESIGKAFLLPIDLIVGWLAYPNQRQRLFNNISETIVVKI